MVTVVCMVKAACVRMSAYVCVCVCVCVTVCVCVCALPACDGGGLWIGIFGAAAAANATITMTDVALTSNTAGGTTSCSRCLAVSVAQLIQVYVCAFPLHRGILCAMTHWCFGAGGGGGALLQVRSSHGAISNISLALSNITASNNAAYSTSQGMLALNGIIMKPAALAVRRETCFKLLFTLRVCGLYTGDGGGLHVAVVGLSAVSNSGVSFSNVTTSSNVAKGMCCCIFWHVEDF